CSAVLGLHSFPTRRSSDLVGVQRVAVVGRLRGAVGPGDRAELAGDAWPGLRGAGYGRPVSGTGPGAPGGHRGVRGEPVQGEALGDRKSTRLNSSHEWISYA